MWKQTHGSFTFHFPSGTIENCAKLKEDCKDGRFWKLPSCFSQNNCISTEARRRPPEIENRASRSRRLQGKFAESGRGSLVELAASSALRGSQKLHGNRKKTSGRGKHAGGQPGTWPQLTRKRTRKKNVPGKRPRDSIAPRRDVSNLTYVTLSQHRWLHYAYERVDEKI